MTYLTGNGRRLSHDIEESDSGRGFIKELSFSHDGRVIASPFAHGARLLAFDSGCSQWRKESEVKTLSEIKFLLGHPMAVCCSKFSPNHMLLATGCLAGRIVLHEPKL
jgi:WD repeat-containing protein 32